MSASPAVNVAPSASGTGLPSFFAPASCGKNLKLCIALSVRSEKGNAARYALINATRPPLRLVGFVIAYPSANASSSLVMALFALIAKCASKSVIGVSGSSPRALNIASLFEVAKTRPASLPFFVITKILLLFIFASILFRIL